MWHMAPLFVDLMLNNLEETRHHKHAAQSVPQETCDVGVAMQMHGIVCDGAGEKWGDTAVD